MRDRTTDRPAPVALVTGFLGSGKTTLLNALLRHPALKDTAVIVNEFGEIGLDHLLIETAFEDAVLLKSGCICCTVRGDLTDTILTLDERRRRGEIPGFARIAIETTGLADPAPIIGLLTEEPRLRPLARLAEVIVTVDAVNAASQLDAQYEPAKQAALADTLVLTKTDLAARGAAEALEARLKSLNPSAQLLRAVKGAVEPGLLFHELRPAAWSARLADIGDGHDHDSSPEHLARHHGIASFTLTHDRPLAWERFGPWLAALAAFRGNDLLRLKGLVNVAGHDRPVLLNGVQHLLHPPVELARWPDADRRSRLVFIGRNLDRDAVARSFAAAVA